MITSQSYVIKGEGIVTQGLEYRLGGIYPIIGKYGVITHGFLYNVDENWTKGLTIITTSWTGSFLPIPSTGWTASFQPAPMTGWTISF